MVWNHEIIRSNRISLTVYNYIGRLVTILLHPLTKYIKLIVLRSERDLRLVVTDTGISITDIGHLWFRIVLYVNNKGAMRWLLIQRHKKKQ